MAPEGTRCLSIPISLGPTQKVREAGFFPAPLLTALKSNSRGTRSKADPDKPVQKPSATQSRPANRTRYNPARGRSRITHQALRDLFFTPDTISIVQPMQEVEVDDRNVVQSRQTFREYALSGSAIADNDCSLC